MAFLGYLIKVGEVVLSTNKYISHGSYISTPNQITDDDTYVDGDGLLHRSTVPHTRSKIEFNTPYLRLADKIALQALLPSRVELSVTYWNDEDNEYQTGKFYVPDITFEIYSTSDTDILYKPIRIAFIEY
jgi:CHASE2 domain-containing sensor protein